MKRPDLPLMPIGGPWCSCIRVAYNMKPESNGAFSERWLCVDCGAEFQRRHVKFAPADSPDVRLEVSRLTKERDEARAQVAALVKEANQRAEDDADVRATDPVGASGEATDCTHAAPEGARAQCCMCGTKGLSTEEDGGPEAELSDGRWVCSLECWEVATGDDLVAAQAERAELIRERADSAHRLALIRGLVLALTKEGA